MESLIKSIAIAWMKSRLTNWYSCSFSEYCTIKHFIQSLEIELEEEMV